MSSAMPEEIPIMTTDIEADQQPQPVENGEFESTNVSGILRSRSTSYDKEPVRDSGEESSRTVNDSSRKFSFIQIYIKYNKFLLIKIFNISLKR